MNRLIGEHYIAVEGLDKAMKLAKTLIECDQQVMIQLDDVDIYIVAYAPEGQWGEKFASLDEEEQEMIEDYRYRKENHIDEPDACAVDDDELPFQDNLRRGETQKTTRKSKKFVDKAAKKLYNIYVNNKLNRFKKVKKSKSQHQIGKIKKNT